jgi:precorrin-6Y C5,15-methyltransferase (decarboxylating)
MSITIVGMGMASPGTLTAEALKELGRADLVIGADRLLSSLDASCRAEKHAAIDPGEIARLIAQSPGQSVCVLMSGDTGFYSGTKKLLEQLGRNDAAVLPGISTVQYFAARLKRP